MPSDFSSPQPSRLFRFLSSPLILIVLSLVILALLFSAFFDRIEENSQSAQYLDFSPHSSWHPLLARPNAFERASVPELSRFRHPLGTENAAFSYNAQATGVLNQKRGGYHTGDDLNGIGGQDSDYGDPLFSPANALVVSTIEPSRGWGKVLILAHRQNGEIFTTQHAHLSHVAVRTEQTLDAGSFLGRLGTSRVSSFSHLHWEWRQGTSLSSVETAYRKDTPENWHQLPAEATLNAQLTEEKIGWPSLRDIQFAADNQEAKISPRLWLPSE